MHTHLKATLRPPHTLCIHLKATLRPPFTERPSSRRGAECCAAESTPHGTPQHGLWGCVGWFGQAVIFLQQDGQLLSLSQLQSTLSHLASLPTAAPIVTFGGAGPATQNS